MSVQLQLLKAVRRGDLAAVRAALDAGALVESDDESSHPGLFLGVACFMGFTDIIRELVKRGASVNVTDNTVPVSPLNMALRGGKMEALRLLVELGAVVPENMNTGLSEHEIMIAELKSIQAGHRAPADETLAALAEDFEEIEVQARIGVDTHVLESDLLRKLGDPS